MKIQITAELRGFFFSLKTFPLPKKEGREKEKEEKKKRESQSAKWRLHDKTLACCSGVVVVAASFGGRRADFGRFCARDCTKIPSCRSPGGCLRDVKQEIVKRLQVVDVNLVERRIREGEGSVVGEKTTTTTTTGRAGGAATRKRRGKETRRRTWVWITTQF